MSKRGREQGSDQGSDPGSLRSRLNYVLSAGAEYLGHAARSNAASDTVVLIDTFRFQGNNDITQRMVDMAKEKTVSFDALDRLSDICLWYSGQSPDFVFSPAASSPYFVFSLSESAEGMMGLTDQRELKGRYHWCMIWDQERTCWKVGGQILGLPIPLDTMVRLSGTLSGKLKATIKSQIARNPACDILEQTAFPSLVAELRQG